MGKNVFILVARNEKIGAYRFPADEERRKIWFIKITSDLVIDK